MFYNVTTGGGWSSDIVSRIPERSVPDSRLPYVLAPTGIFRGSNESREFARKPTITMGHRSTPTEMLHREMLAHTSSAEVSGTRMRIRVTNRPSLRDDAGAQSSLGAAAPRPWPRPRSAAPCCAWRWRNARFRAVAAAIQWQDCSRLFAVPKECCKHASAAATGMTSLCDLVTAVANASACVMPFVLLALSTFTLNSKLTPNTPRSSSFRRSAKAGGAWGVSGSKSRQN